MNYPFDDLYDDIPTTLTSVKPKLLTISGSGYPWRLLTEEQLSPMEALMLSGIDCFAVDGEETQECS